MRHLRDKKAIFFPPGFSSSKNSQTTGQNWKGEANFNSSLPFPLAPLTLRH